VDLCPNGDHSFELVVFSNHPLRSRVGCVLLRCVLKGGIRHLQGSITPPHRIAYTRERVIRLLIPRITRRVDAARIALTTSCRLVDERRRLSSFVHVACTTDMMKRIQSIDANER